MRDSVLKIFQVCVCVCVLVVLLLWWWFACANSWDGRIRLGLNRGVGMGKSSWGIPCQSCLKPRCVVIKWAKRRLPL